MNTTQESITTKQKLIEAAGEVFAQKGFRDATVRDICEKAGANVAAINYHFGDKEKLYAEVFRYVHEVDCQIKAEEINLNCSNLNLECPKEKLKHYIELMVRKMLMPGKFSWKGTLMAREMVDPSPVLDQIVENGIRPLANELRQIVASIINLPVDDVKVKLCSDSIFGQIFFHKHGMEINSRLNPEYVYDQKTIEYLAEHISSFSLSGLSKYLP